MGSRDRLYVSLVALFGIIPLNIALGQTTETTNAYWWPKQLDLSPLRINDSQSNPLGTDFNYPKAFNTLDLAALIEDLKKVMTTSQSWWPADYGNYGPFFIRMTWHSAGTYRVFDGRGGADGGMQRFAPLNSWPDNTNLDKARRLLWPIKQKYGNKISWSDLMVLAGNVAMESMGFKTLGFAGGREDAWQPEYINWGNEKKWLADDQRFNTNKKLKKPYAATQMGLIYVNPEGPAGNPDPKAAAQDIRVTFGRMAMNDEETVALIIGGHAFGKAHGAASATHLGPAPEAAPIEAQGFGWKNDYKTGHGENTITSGLEGAWSISPVKWSNNYLENLFKYNWVKTKSPAGATQWMPDDKTSYQLVPDAHDPSKRHPPMMFTTDLALKEDPNYRQIAERFLKNPKDLELAFAKAWFKLIHRDMGPKTRYLGNLVPKETFIWQDPIPPVTYQLVNSDEIAALKTKILDSGLTIPQLVRTAWASAASFRKTDMRGGANGGRLRLAPQKDWPVNSPTELKIVLDKLEKIKNDFNQQQTGPTRISLADMIVLAGSAAIEQAAKTNGHAINVSFSPGRNDALQSETDTLSFDVLKPTADGFRNYYETGNHLSPEQMLVEKAYMLNLTVPEMTVLIGGLRTLNANEGQTKLGVFTKKPGTLSNAFFIELLNMDITWRKSTSESGVYEGLSRKTGQLKWKASSVDLIFGANSELRAVAEVYAQDNAEEKFIHDFVAAWVKVMNLDRFDLNENCHHNI